MKKLSVVISAHNEEEKLPLCLSSVLFADEIIVIDNESTDTTVEIAKKHNAKIFSRPNNPMLNVNKNFGFTKATSEWILSLDADERVSEELQKEIQSVLLQSDAAISGYSMPRKNIIFGKWIEHTGWYPDYNLRLFKKGMGKFQENHVHEKIIVDGEEEKLRGPIIHESYQSVGQFLQKMYMIYAPNEAEQLIKKGYVFSYGDAVRFPFQEFLGRFFARDGYKDGFHGLMLSLLMAFYHLVVFAYIWEKKKFVDEEKNVSTILTREVDLAAGEFRHWRYEMRIHSQKNAMKKLYLRFLRKMPHI